MSASPSLPTLALALAALLAPLRPAVTGAKSPDGPVPSSPAEIDCFLDPLLNLAHPYKEDSNPWVEEVALTGRYQGQYYAVDSTSNDIDNWENRRFRVGAKAWLAHRHLRLKGEFNLDLDNGDFYTGFSDLSLKVLFSDSVNLTVGKLEPRYGFERSQSDRFHIYLERSTGDELARPDFAAGAAVDGKLGRFRYFAGVFSNSVGEEFGDFDGGMSLSTGVAYDLSSVLGLERAKWELDSFYSRIEPGDDIFNRYDSGFATYLDMKRGPWGLVPQVMYGHGDADGRSDWAFMIMPSFDITQSLQLVTRYQYGHSRQSDGLLPRARYERLSGGTPGGQYNAAYLGLNYYICEHKLKLMTGLEYARLDRGSGSGYEGWTLLSGARLYW